MFHNHVLGKPTPASVRKSVQLPRREAYYPSPASWQNEVLYFLLVDRFSDGQEGTRPLLNRANLAAARPALPDGSPWAWSKWAESGCARFQGGTIRGAESKLPYIAELGATTVWLSPVFKQRAHLNTYHGYGIQDFLEVDPRFGTREDLTAFVAAAHQAGLRVILDIIFNHSGSNWVYAEGTPGGIHMPHYNASGSHRFGAWLDGAGEQTSAAAGRDDAVWPVELQSPEVYTRAGKGSLGDEDYGNPRAEHKRTDFEDLRDLNLDTCGVLSDLAKCYKYWIALTDCDGFRIDTLKHVTCEHARNFCGGIKEFCDSIGKRCFLLLGEVAGGDKVQDVYLDSLERNLDATLDIGGMRPLLSAIAKGLAEPKPFFDGFNPGDIQMGSHRNVGSRHVSVLDDHDHVLGTKIRFSVDASTEHQVVAGVALQFFTLGIPCIYYGTEQALAGPEAPERQWLPGWLGEHPSDRYLREAMFGPEYPRADGVAGVSQTDAGLPGFGPFGTAGCHCFDPQHPAYLRIAAMARVRKAIPALRFGRQYPRGIRVFGDGFGLPGAGEIIAWSRILDDEEWLCALNTSGTEDRGAQIVVDAVLNLPGSTMQVMLNTAEAACSGAYSGDFAAGTAVPVQHTGDGTAFVHIHPVKPSELILLTNHPLAQEGGVT